ncbi:hypothetical protein [Allofranklinella schreckenbergeri]|uniref:hypothetical protein n=1 Tax=Allofranklinella schreckenbergeri TaxID=1076744 RepID=UPI001EEE2286|nr:hypothetical protein [Allofranklinella schreckenbergeri]
MHSTPFYISISPKTAAQGCRFLVHPPSKPIKRNKTTLFRHDDKQIIFILI